MRVVERERKAMQAGSDLSRGLGLILATPGHTLHGAEHLDLILKVHEIHYHLARGQSATLDITRFLAEWLGHHSPVPGHGLRHLHQV